MMTRLTSSPNNDYTKMMQMTTMEAPMYLLVQAPKVNECDR
jgi:hypothetical protein